MKSRQVLVKYEFHEATYNEKCGLMDCINNFLQSLLIQRNWLVFSLRRNVFARFHIEFVT